MYNFETTDYLYVKPAEKVLEVKIEAPSSVTRGQDFDFKVIARNLKSTILSEVSGVHYGKFVEHLKGTVEGNFETYTLIKRKFGTVESDYSREPSRGRSQSCAESSHRDRSQSQADVSRSRRPVPAEPPLRMATNQNQSTNQLI